MDNRVAKRFIEEVNELIPEADRQLVFDALKRYQSISDLNKLLEDLRKVLDEPTKLEIYEYVRPLIPPKHQVEYDKLAPAPPGRKLRVVNLKRRSNESLGFAVRGGFEHSVGVFVSQVVQGSQADEQGLKVGDEIVRVNGFTIAEAIHEEVLNLIKGRDEIELKVTNIGMLPIKSTSADPITWQYVEKPAKKQREKSQRVVGKSVPDQNEDVKLFVNLRAAESLGCGIVSGPVHFRGIFVERVRPGSLAEEIGIEIGDQIIEVNKTSFVEISHKQAVVALKSSRELHMTIRKKVGLPLVTHMVDENGKDNKMEQPVHTEIPVHVHREETHDDDNNQRFISVIDHKVHNISNQKEIIVAEFKKKDELNRKDKLAKREEAEKELERKLEEERKKEEELREKIRLQEEEELKELRRKIEEEEAERERLEEIEKQERETAERLKKMLEEKLEQQRREAERLRMEIFEENKRRRHAMEKNLLRKIKENQKTGEKEKLLRAQRRKQDEAEMMREATEKHETSGVGPEGRGGVFKRPSLKAIVPTIKQEMGSEEQDYVSDIKGNTEEQIHHGHLRSITPISDLDTLIRMDRAHKMDTRSSSGSVPTTYIDSIVPSESHLPATLIE